MLTKACIILISLLLTGCTTRGGWPRFLRPGERMFGESKSEKAARLQAVFNDADAISEHIVQMRKEMQP